MKLRVTAYPEPVEVDVEVDGGDLIAALGENADGFPLSAQLHYFVNRLAELLKAIPDEQIAELTPAVRNTISTFCTEQAERFAAPIAKVVR